MVKLLLRSYIDYIRYYRNISHIVCRNYLIHYKYHGAIIGSRYVIGFGGVCATRLNIINYLFGYLQCLVKNLIITAIMRLSSFFDYLIS